MTSSKLQLLPRKLTAIELQLTEAQRTLKRASPLVKESWVPIARASAKAQMLLKDATELGVPSRAGQEIVPYFRRRPRLEAALNSTVELWDDVKAFLRYSPRGVENPASHAPHTLDRVRSVRAEIVFEKRWISRFLSPPELHSASEASRDVSAERVNGVSQRDLIEGPSHELAEPTLSSPHADLTHTSEEIPIELFLAPDYLRTRRYRVFFGTNRTLVGKRFTNDTSPALSLGSCSVYVPKTHRFGSTGSPWFTRLIRVVRRQEDDRLRVDEKTILTKLDFKDSIVEELGKGSARTALIVVHGYNVDFEEAARRTAQIGFDLRVDGVTAFFSWPSKGRLLPYMHDEEAVQEAEPYFVEFIQLLVSMTDVSEVNILAHSMGNRLLLRTIDRLVRLREQRPLPTPIGHIVLAAADLPRRVFLNHAHSYRRAAVKRVTSYSCTRDLPLRLSKGAHGRDRVGLEPPVLVTAGVDSISAADLDLHGLGHGYYAETEALLYDLSELIHENKHPNLRMRLEPCISADGQYWMFRR